MMRFPCVAAAAARLAAFREAGGRPVMTASTSVDGWLGSSSRDIRLRGEIAVR